MLMDIPEDVADRLEKLAQEQGSSVADVLKTLLNRYAPETLPGSLARDGSKHAKAGLASAQLLETAERSRTF